MPQASTKNCLIGIVGETIIDYKNGSCGFETLSESFHFPLKLSFIFLFPRTTNEIKALRTLRE